MSDARAIQVLTVCGSLQARSTNRAALEAIDDLTRNLLDAVTRPATDLVALATRVAASFGISPAHIAPE